MRQRGRWTRNVAGMVWRCWSVCRSPIPHKGDWEPWQCKTMESLMQCRLSNISCSAVSLSLSLAIVKLGTGSSAIRFASNLFYKSWRYGREEVWSCHSHNTSCDMLSTLQLLVGIAIDLLQSPSWRFDCLGRSFRRAGWSTFLLCGLCA